MSDYSITFSEIFRRYIGDNSDQPPEDISEDVADAIYERVDDLGPIAEWPNAVRNFHVLYTLIAQVENGGMAQAAYNIPELLPRAVHAFHELDCKNAADFCSKAVALLPRELSEHTNKGIEVTDSIGDVFAHFKESDMARLNEQIPDDFWVEERLGQYAIENREQFISLDQRL